MSNIQNWSLWKLFEKKECSNKFRVAVENVCKTGIELSKTIILTFPNFTLHDETHIHNVCDWMHKLLSEDEREALTANETAMLLMSACCHDVGMSVTDAQKKELLSDFSTDNWKEYFNNFPQDYSKRNKEKEQDRIIRNYVRVNHHARIDENLSEEDWSDDLEDEGVFIWKT